MARCNQCGSELPDYYTSCPNCGGGVVRQAPPVQPAQPMNGYIPMAQQREVTGMGAWFGWSLLCGILPIRVTIRVGQVFAVLVPDSDGLYSFAFSRHTPLIKHVQSNVYPDQHAKQREDDQDAELCDRKR